MPRDSKPRPGCNSSPFRSPKGLSLSESERDEFLTAVADLNPPREELLPPDETPARVQPRRMKQLERGELMPAGELDLHGLTRAEAVARTRLFLAGAVHQGWQAVVIVTGKGLHSSAGPVLRQAVERLLDGSPELVLEWGQAPRRFGGAGALAVFLRSAKREAGSEQKRGQN